MMKRVLGLGMLLWAGSLPAQTPVTIQELQCNWDSTYASTYVGQTVVVSGVVSTNFGSVGTSRSFFIQDRAGGPCSGVMVYVPSSAGTPSITIGDSVTLTGVVGEYFGNTQVQVNNLANLIVHTNVGAPNPTVIMAGLLDTTATSGYFGSQPDTAEMYEHVLVEVVGFVADTGLAQGDWTVTDGTGFAYVRKNGRYTYNPRPGDPLTVRGIVHTYFNLYRIQPRSDADVIVQMVHISHAYARGTNQVDVVFSTEIGQAQAENVSNYTLRDSTMTTTIPITVATQDPGNRRRVTLTLGQSLNPGALYHLMSTIPNPAETASFYGLLTLAQIQSDTATGGDASNWAGRVVSVRVVVTADPTAISFTSSAWAFFQDPGGGPWSGIMTYAPGIAPNFTVGDSLLVVGEVTEFNGMTEIVNIIYWETLGQNAAVVADNVQTGDVGEMWEGCLVTVTGTVQSITGARFVLDDGTGPVRVNADTSITNNLNVGDVATVTGVVRYTGGNYVIYVRTAIDVPVEEGKLPVGAGLRLLTPVVHDGTVVLAAPGRSSLDVRILDVLGRKVQEVRVPVVNGLARISGLRLASGVYFLKTGEATFRFVRLR